MRKPWSNAWELSRPSNLDLERSQIYMNKFILSIFYVFYHFHPRAWNQNEPFLLLLLLVTFFLFFSFPWGGEIRFNNPCSSTVLKRWWNTAPHQKRYKSDHSWVSCCVWNSPLQNPQPPLFYQTPPKRPNLYPKSVPNELFETASRTSKRRFLCSFPRRYRVLWHRVTYQFVRTCMFSFLFFFFFLLLGGIGY